MRSLEPPRRTSASRPSRSSLTVAGTFCASVALAVSFIRTPTMLRCAMRERWRATCSDDARRYLANGMSTRQPVGSAELPRPPALAQVAADDLEIPEQLSGRRLRSRLLFGAGLVLVVIAIVTLLPGLDGLRTRLSHAQPGWLLLGVGLKVLSGLGYVAVFRMVFCRRMTWRVSFQIGMSELGANALFPTGGAGGLALGAWALRRGGMPASEIARRTVAFFLLSSLPNVLGVIVLGIGLGLGVFGGEHSLLLTAVPAALAAAAIGGVLVGGRLAGRQGSRAGGPSGAEPSRHARALRSGLTALGEGVEEALVLL